MAAQRVSSAQGATIAGRSRVVAGGRCQVLLPGAAPNRRSLAAGGKWTWPLVLLVFRGSRRGQVELCLNVLRSSQGYPSRSREPPAAEASQAQSPSPRSRALDPAERLQGLGSWHLRFFPTYCMYIRCLRYDTIGNQCNCNLPITSWRIVHTSTPLWITPTTAHHVYCRDLLCYL
jgi:hypothetical protein